jgi:hypothetical protein
MPFLGRTQRRIRRHLPWVNKAPVQWVFSDRYDLDLRFPTADALRAQRLLSFIEREGILRSGDLHRARRVAMSHLLRVHHVDYLRSLETAEGISRVFGIPVDPAMVDELLLWQRAMVGGTMLSARLALRDGITLFNLGGGLHHARADRGQGYCLFNDIAIAIHFLRRRWLFGERVLVVDLRGGLLRGHMHRAGAGGDRRSLPRPDQARTPAARRPIPARARVLPRGS